MSRFVIRHVPQHTAKAFIREHHAHLPKPPAGMLLALGLYEAGELVGVGLLGTTSVRLARDGDTVEITRCCIMPGHPGAASAMKAKLCRLAQAMGYARTITYTLEHEVGGSVSGAGATREHLTAGGEWSRSGRARKPAVQAGRKWRWSWAHPPAPVRIEGGTP